MSCNFDRFVMLNRIECRLSQNVNSVVHTATVTLFFERQRKSQIHTPGYAIIIQCGGPRVVEDTFEGVELALQLAGIDLIEQRAHDLRRCFHESNACKFGRRISRQKSGVPIPAQRQRTSPAKMYTCIRKSNCQCLRLRGESSASALLNKLSRYP